VFLREVPLPLPVGAGVGLLVVLAWLGTTAERRRWARHVVAENRRLLLLLAVLLAWITVTGAWAGDLGLYGLGVYRWWTAALLFVIVATSASDAGKVRLLMAAFVAGAVLSVLVGLTGFHPPLVETSSTRGRLYGGSGDPNFSAVGYLAGIILAAGLLASARRPPARLALLGALAVLAAGLAATQSRGALVGAAAAIVAALALYPRRRARVLAVVAAATAVVALVLSAVPGAERILVGEQTREPRADIWLVAWRVASDHPLAGVGLDNFSRASAGYIREPGSLQYGELFVDRPVVAHNTFLQLLADTGIAGVLLFAAFVLGCLAAAVRAARRLDAQRRPALASCARAVAVAIVAVVAASLFLSNAPDPRTWLLLALGPTLLSLASASTR
jgi:O-antigen ligase